MKEVFKPNDKVLYNNLECRVIAVNNNYANNVKIIETAKNKIHYVNDKDIALLERIYSER